MYQCILLSLALVTIYKHNINYVAILVKVERCGKATNDSTSLALEKTSVRFERCNITVLVLSTLVLSSRVRYHPKRVICTA